MRPKSCHYTNLNTSGKFGDGRNWETSQLSPVFLGRVSIPFMRFDDPVQAYADKLLSQSQNRIDADHKKKIEAVFRGQMNSLIPSVMYNLVEAYMERYDDSARQEWKA